MVHCEAIDPRHQLVPIASHGTAVTVMTALRSPVVHRSQLFRFWCRIDGKMAAGPHGGGIGPFLRGTFGGWHLSRGVPHLPCTAIDLDASVVEFPERP